MDCLLRLLLSCIALLWALLFVVLAIALRRKRASDGGDHGFAAVLAGLAGFEVVAVTLAWLPVRGGVWMLGTAVALGLVLVTGQVVGTVALSRSYGDEAARRLRLGAAARRHETDATPGAREPHEPPQES